MPPGNRPAIPLVLDGVPVEVPDDGGTLLAALRDHLGVRSAKDGCSPQGQCGCCTVLVDGQARVACVTPVRRVAGRAISTVAALSEADRWAAALCATGGSQCGFCTPGIAVRLSALAASGAAGSTDGGVAACERALLAHLCRCTGWLPILDAWKVATDAERGDLDPWAGRDPEAAAKRASLEGGVAQAVAPSVALGGAPFAADTVPEGALVAVPDTAGGWAVGETLAEARASAGKVQGRRTTLASGAPLAVPHGDWDITLRTAWCEPGYLETDASWCDPGGEPSSPLANGGAFGGKQQSPLPAAARTLADRLGRPVVALWSREDATRLGPKRPPMAAGLRADGTGEVVVARTPGIAGALRSFPGLDLRVAEVDVPGPPTSRDLRAAGWAEAAVLAAGLTGESEVSVTDPSTGGRATARVSDGAVHIRVNAGRVLDEPVLRSYCTGAAHQALGWITSEGLTVTDDGEVLDLTIRSFGILRAVDMPPVELEIIDADETEPVKVSDAVFAAVAGATWVAQGCPPELPTGRKVRT